MKKIGFFFVLLSLFVGCDFSKGKLKDGAETASKTGSKSGATASSSSTNAGLVGELKFVSSQSIDITDDFPKARPTAVHFANIQTLGSRPDSIVIDFYKGVLILPISKDGTLSTGSDPLAVGAYTKLIDDFNHDGYADLFSYDETHLSVDLGGSSSPLKTAVSTDISVKTCCEEQIFSSGDFNGDKRPDLLFIKSNTPSDRTFYIFTGKSDGSFEKDPVQSGSIDAKVQSTGSPEFNNAGLADLNADGRLDLVLPSYNNDYKSPGQKMIAVMLGTGDGKFSDAVFYKSGDDGMLESPTFALADFNGDGKMDLAIQSVNEISAPSSNPLRILLGNGDGSFQAPVLISLGDVFGVSNVIAAGDFDGDGKADLINVKIMADAGLILSDKPKGIKVTVLTNQTSFK